jgi:hypothetical protein
MWFCGTQCVSWDIWASHPPVGVWIGILGLLGAAVALTRDPTKISQREKAVWILAMTALLLLEVKSVYQDRNEHDREQKETRERETEHFQEIANGIDHTIHTSEQQFETTTADMKALTARQKRHVLTAHGAARALHRTRGPRGGDPSRASKNL